jgi:putative tricarboxylic transport membrane protein
MPIDGALASARAAPLTLSRRKLGVWAGASLCSLVMLRPKLAAADWKPNKPVEIVVGAGPGGGNDRIARFLQKAIQDLDLVKGTVIVVNKPGAGGAVAQTYINSHAGDGHYLLVVNPSLITNPLVGIGSQTYHDVTPIADLLADYVVLVGRTALPYKSGAELLAGLKANPTSLSIAVAPGLGTGPHIAIAALAQNAGIDPAQLRIIPYSSSAEAMTALLGGQLDLLPSTSENVQAMVAADKVRAYGVSAPQRLGGVLAGVPTWREQGDDVVYNNWRGVVGPRNMTVDQVAFWTKVLSAISQSDEWKQDARNSFVEPDLQGPAVFADTLKNDDAQERAVLGHLKLLKTA